VAAVVVHALAPVQLRLRQLVRCTPGVPSNQTRIRLFLPVVVLRAPLQAVAPAAANVEAADVQDLPGDERDVQSMRLSMEVRLVVLAQQMEAGKRRSRSAAASGAAGV
jgi:hypothetical protein